MATTRDYISDYQVGKPVTPNGQQNSSYKPNLLNTILSTVGAVGGGIAGGVGGVGAGALIPGADLTGVPEAALGYTGAVTGAGVGSGGGNALADFIRSLAGDKTVSTQQTLKDTPGQMAIGAGSEAVGLPLAKGLGYLAHPIAPFIDMVDKKLASSAKSIDFGQLLSDYEENVLPKLRQSGFGQKSTDAFNELRNNITDAVSAFKSQGAKPVTNEATQVPNEMTSAGGLSEPSRYNYSGPLRDPIPASGKIPADASDMSLPIAQANQLKRNLTSQVSNYYGFDTGKPNIEATKQFGNLLRGEISNQEPGVAVPNKIASTLYKFPDMVDSLAKILSLGQPGATAAIEKIGGLPFRTIQKAIPQGGGYLRQLLPALFNAGAGASQE